MLHLTSHISQSAAYTSVPVKLTRGLFNHFNKSRRKSLRCWQVILTVLLPDVSGESGICQCVFVFLGAGTSHIVWACGSCRTPFTALCGSVRFYWSVMKFPRIINPELCPYMSPAVRRRCPRAACLFQFTARTDIWVQTWCFISELFNGEDIAGSLKSCS